MQRYDTTRPGPSERGSALILVLLLMLALSAIGMVALQNVTRSIDRSGLYRVRITSSAFSDAAATFWLRHSAGKAGDVVEKMNEGKGCLSRLGITESEWRGRLREQMNGCAWYIGSPDSFGDVLTTSSEESGLFTDGTRGSFERRTETTAFDVVVRDPFPARRPAGFSEDKYCFKNVTVATQGQLGALADSWDRPQQVGRGRTSFLGKIGPLPCDSK